MCGVLVGGLMGLIFHLSPADNMTLAVVGMSGCLGAVVRAPLTGILIVFEMTHEFSLVPALMLGALVSQTVARRLNAHSFYDALLLQDGHQLEHVIPPAICRAGSNYRFGDANFHPVVIDDLSPAKLRDFLGAHPYQRFPFRPKSNWPGC